MKATALVILLFASIALNAFLAIERETTRETLDDARRHGFAAVEDRPGCGWVRVPRCGGCGRFHVRTETVRRPYIIDGEFQPPFDQYPPSMILPGPAPTLAPPREEFETYPTPVPVPVPEDAMVDSHEFYRRPVEVPETLWAGL